MNPPVADRSESDPSFPPIEEIKILDFNGLSLIGRDKEVDFLKECFKQSKTRKQLVLIGGVSGIGKSALSHHLACEVKCSFISGKFLVGREEKAAAPILQACNQLCRELRSLPNFEKVSTDLRRELEYGDTEVIFRLVPELGRVVGSKENPETLPAAKLSYQDSQIKLQLAFRRLFRVASRHLSLVLMIDDMQWADQSSISLLEFLLQDRENYPLMVMLCFREEGVLGAHQFSAMVKRLNNRKSLTVRRCSIGKLDQAAVLDVVCKLLRCPEEREVKDLAKALYKHTDGHVRFLLQLLQLLASKGLLEHWKWNVDAIKLELVMNTNMVPDSIVQSRLASLPIHAQNLIKLAAVLGTEVHLNVFEAVVEDYYRHTFGNSPYFEVPSSANVWRLGGSAVVAHGVQIGLLAAEDVDASRFSWTHDSDQEAVYNLIPRRMRSNLRLRISKILRAKLDEEKTESLLFLVTTLQNKSKNLIPSTASVERIGLAELNLKSGKKSMEVSAFQEANMYSETGITLLPLNSWRTHCTLSMDLYTCAAQSTLCLGEHEKSQKYSRKMIGCHLVPLLDKRNAYVTLTRSLQAQGKFLEVVTLFQALLDDLGCTIPRRCRLLRSVPVFLDAKKNVDDFLGGDPDSSLQRQMTDPKKVWVSEILGELFMTGKKLQSPDVVALSIAQTFRLFTQLGVCETTPVVLARMGVALATKLKDYNTAIRYSDQALQVLSETRSTRLFAETTFVVYGFVNHWQRELDYLPFVKGYEVGMATGNIENAFLNATFFIDTKLIKGAVGTLGSLFVEAFNYITQMEELATNSWALSVVQLQAIANLVTERQHPEKLDGDHLDREQFLSEMEAGRYGPVVTIRAIFNMWEMFLAFMFDDDESLFQLRNDHDESTQRDLLGPMHTMIHIDYFVALCATSRYRETKKRWYKKIAVKVHRELVKLTKAGNPNVIHYELLLRAEILDIKGDFNGAISYYNAAIAKASQIGWVKDHGTAKQRLAEHYLRRNNLEEGRWHIVGSIRLFKEWGAHGKVCHMKNRYHKLLDQDG